MILQEAFFARAIAAEAGEAPFAVQVALAAVTLHRMEAFHTGLEAVLLADGFLDCVHDGTFPGKRTEAALDPAVLQAAWEAVRLALAGSDPTDGALYVCRLPFPADATAGVSVSSLSPQTDGWTVTFAVDTWCFGR